jgi:serine/threonine-protein kinase
MLADGGMGLVVAATHLQLEQTVALKFFRGDLRTRGEPLMRFTQEAKAAAQLKSEHVARVLDAGVTEGGTPYIVMEYLEGRSLDKIVAAEGPLDVPSATEYAIHACEGLAEAHARGIIHRDIKTSNLFLAERSPGWRTIKILDFGISKVSLAQASNITTDQNMVMGTPCYMSPEQLQSTATVDHRTDIWSLGASLYEMLTGKVPFDPSLPLPAIAEAIVSKPVPVLGPEIPLELAAIVGRSMSKDRDERFQSAAAFAMALLPFAGVRARVSAERAASMTPALPEIANSGNNDDARQFQGNAGILARELLENQPRAAVWWPPSPKALVVTAAVLICGVVAIGSIDTGRPRHQAVVAIPATALASPAPALAPAAAAPTLTQPSPRPSPSSALVSLDKRPKASPSRKMNLAARRGQTIDTKRVTMVRAVEIAPVRLAPAMMPQLVDHAGGRSPLRPLQTKNPYGNP